MHPRPSVAAHRDDEGVRGMPDMPVVSEQDIEQLEAYVDGELTTTEEDALRARLARLVAKVDAAVDRETSWSYRISTFRRVAAAAACIVLGVLIGRTADNDGRAMMPGGPVAQVPGGGP